MAQRKIRSIAGLHRTFVWPKMRPVTEKAVRPTFLQLLIDVEQPHNKSRKKDILISGCILEPIVQLLNLTHSWQYNIVEDKCAYQKYSKSWKYQTLCFRFKREYNKYFGQIK